MKRKRTDTTCALFDDKPTSAVRVNPVDESRGVYEVTFHKDVDVAHCLIEIQRQVCEMQAKYRADMAK